MSKQIQIFKAGKHTAMSGVALSFTESDLQAMVNAYDPAVHEAPIVIGHPQTDNPAYGWAKSLHYADGVVAAEPQQLDPEFSEMVNAGRFKKVSASFYTPDSPSNPVPGVYYLRHIGFLGAQAPAVKGLKTASFAHAEEGVIEFADWDQMTISGLFRKLREWIISTSGVEVADQTLPAYEIESLQINAAQSNEDSNASPNYSETPDFKTKGDEMSDVDKKRLADLEAENTQLKAANSKFEAEKAEFAEVQAKQKTAAAHAENVSFAESLVKAGKLLPVNQALTVALLDKFASDETKLEFGEGDAKKTDTPLALYKSTLEAAPKLVEFGEKGKPEGALAVKAFVAPAGFTVNQENLELHEKALAFAEANNVDYVTAINKITQAS